MCPVTQSLTELYCYGCGAVDPRREGHVCLECGSPLSIRSKAVPDTRVFQQRPDSMWDYFELLPIASRDNIVSIQEGATPLLYSTRLHEKVGTTGLLLKNEMANPTGSFKDRQVSVGISRAKELGSETVAVVSSGNVACAASAYAARAGMRAVLLMHKHAAPSKIRQAAVYGGRAIRVDSPSANAVFELCLKACAAFGWYHLSTAGIYEPYNVEGAKTIAYELFAQTKGQLPDVVVAPVGGGGLLGGVWRGFQDLERLGLIKASPRLVGVQPAGCAPLVEAFEKNTPFLETLKHPWPNPETVAGGLADDILFDGHTALPALRETGGMAIAVTDDEILDAEVALAETEGLLCEPSCAVTIAALNHLPKDWRQERICCLITGTGIKDLDVLAGRVDEAPVIQASLENLEKVLGGTE